MALARGFSIGASLPPSYITHSTPVSLNSGSAYLTPITVPVCRDLALHSISSQTLWLNKRRGRSSRQMRK